MADVEQALHLGQGILLHILRRVKVGQSHLRLDQECDHVARSGQVDGVDLSLGVDDGGVRRTGAHVQNGQGLVGARGGEGAADGHVGLHAAHLDRDADLLGKFPGDGLHLEAVRLDHGGDAHGVLLGKLVGQAALNLLGCECVDRQQILNLDVPGVLASQIRHDLAHLLQHAAGVGSRLSPHILQAGNGLHGLHDLVGPVVHIHFDAAVFPQ